MIAKTNINFRQQASVKLDGQYLNRPISVITRKNIGSWYTYPQELSYSYSKADPMSNESLGFCKENLNGGFEVHLFGGSGRDNGYMKIIKEPSSRELQISDLGVIGLNVNFSSIGSCGVYAENTNEYIIFGGQNTEGYIGRIDISTRNERWVDVGSIYSTYFLHSRAVYYNGKIYVIGGNSTGYMDSQENEAKRFYIFEYDPDNDLWIPSSSASLTYPFVSGQACILNNVIHIFGTRYRYPKKKDYNGNDVEDERNEALPTKHCYLTLGVGSLTWSDGDNTGLEVINIFSDNNNVYLAYENNSIHRFNINVNPGEYISGNNSLETGITRNAFMCYLEGALYLFGGNKNQKKIRTSTGIDYKICYEEILGAGLNN